MRCPISFSSCTQRNVRVTLRWFKMCKSMPLYRDRDMKHPFSLGEKYGCFFVLNFTMLTSASVLLGHSLSLLTFLQSSDKDNLTKATDSDGFLKSKSGAKTQSFPQNRGPKLRVKLIPFLGPNRSPSPSGPTVARSHGPSPMAKPWQKHGPTSPTISSVQRHSPEPRVDCCC